MSWDFWAFFLNLIFGCFSFYVLRSCFKSRKALKSIRVAEDAYLASMMRCRQCSEIYEKTIKDQIDVITAQALMREFMKGKSLD